MCTADLHKALLEGVGKTVQRIEMAARLSDHMKKHLGVDVDPVDLYFYINRHWPKVSTLAHAIHHGDSQ